VAASRSAGVDLITGAGLREALRHAEVVVDATNSSYDHAGRSTAFFEMAGANLFDAERHAGVARHVTLSAVGTDRFRGSGYFRAKARQEEIAASSGIPCTIVRSTPFHEFVYNIVDQGGEGDVIRLPPIDMQPIGSADVAAALAEVVVDDRLIDLIELAGPDVHPLPAIAEAILVANEDMRTIVVDPDAPYLGVRVAAPGLIGGGSSRCALTSFDDWLRRSLQPLELESFR
jgi:uncharacterized protein YbjT (DUF2867 family)